MSRIATLVLCSTAVALMACTARRTPPADSSAATAGRPVASTTAPTTPSVAQLGGTWRGETFEKDRDSVLAGWTLVASGDTGLVTFATGKKVTMRDIHVVGDSIESTLGPFVSAAPGVKGQLVVEEVRSQVHGDSLVGTLTVRLASEPSKITSELRFGGVRVKP